MRKRLCQARYRRHAVRRLRNRRVRSQRHYLRSLPCARGGAARLGAVHLRAALRPAGASVCSLPCRPLLDLAVAPQWSNKWNVHSVSRCLAERALAQHAAGLGRMPLRAWAPRRPTERVRTACLPRVRGGAVRERGIVSALSHCRVGAACELLHRRLRVQRNAWRQRLMPHAAGRRQLRRSVCHDTGSLRALRSWPLQDNTVRPRQPGSVPGVYARPLPTRHRCCTLRAVPPARVASGACRQRARAVLVQRRLPAS